MTTQRKIIHIDMDAFFASIEQRDNPELQGKAIAVGSSSERGVVATCSYEARKFGVHSAMSSVVAKRLCPDLIFVRPHFDVYEAVSHQIMSIFREFTDKIEMFKERKVRILNGAHTSMVLGAYLAGFDYVGQCMADPAVRAQLDQSVYGEIVPTVHMPKEKAEEFATAVFERFENPFVKHALLSISLNSISKWRARVLPSFKDSIANNGGKLPKWLTYSYAALLAFYHTTEKGEKCLIGSRGTNTYEIHDDADKLAKVAEWAALTDDKYIHNIMTQTEWWGEDLTQIAGFEKAVAGHFSRIAEVGAKAHIAELGKQE